jgi:ketosteroid isomerase-like protein
VRASDAVSNYLRCFGNGDIDGVAATLAEDAVIEGPLGSFLSRDEYVAALRADPPVATAVTVIARTGTGDEVTVFYTCGKPGGRLTVAQLFRLRGGLIHGSLLVFSPREPER